MQIDFAKLRPDQELLVNRMGNTTTQTQYDYAENLEISGLSKRDCSITIATMNIESAMIDLYVAGLYEPEPLTREQFVDFAGRVFDDRQRRVAELIVKVRQNFAQGSRR